MLPGRIELSTSPLPRECSTTELRQPAAAGRRVYRWRARRVDGAGECHSRAGAASDRAGGRPAPIPFPADCRQRLATRPCFCPQPTLADRGAGSSKGSPSHGCSPRIRRQIQLDGQTGELSTRGQHVRRAGLPLTGNPQAKTIRSRRIASIHRPTPCKVARQRANTAAVKRTTKFMAQDALQPCLAGPDERIVKKMHALQPLT